MTVPIERTNSVIFARKFLLDLTNPKITPRLPKQVRQRALMLLRHYPNEFEMNLIAEREDKTIDPLGYKIFGKDYK